MNNLCIHKASLVREHPRIRSRRRGGGEGALGSRAREITRAISLFTRMSLCDDTGNNDFDQTDSVRRLSQAKVKRVYPMSYEICRTALMMMMFTSTET